jgi:DNA-binding MarR family transcriptional regulator
VVSPVAAADLVETARTVYRTSRAYQQSVLDGQIPASSATLLAFLDQHGEQRLGKLAELLAVDPSTLSRQVVSAEQLGLVCRRPDPLDGRANLLALTPAGRASLAHNRSCWGGLLVAALDDWSDDEVGKLVAALQKLQCAMRAAHRATHV